MFLWDLSSFNGIFSAISIPLFIRVFVYPRLWKFISSSLKQHFLSILFVIIVHILRSRV